MTRLVIPPDVEWELLVVNNNSTDSTEDVIEQYKGTLPIRSLFESNPGLSHARNRAVPDASGDYLLWTDDDALVDDAWLAAYHRAFECWPDASVFGGPIEALWEGTPPAWLQRTLDRLAGAFSLRDLGREPIRLSPDDDALPFGVNYAVRADVQRRHLYDPHLGTRPDHTSLRGEETRVLRAMLTEGRQGRWVPEARVRHWIPRERQTTRYLRRLFAGLGHTDALVKPDESVRLLGRPRWIYREAVVAEARYRTRRLIAPPEMWIEDLIRASVAWGRLRSYGRRTDRLGGGRS
jgi:glycosyltransferase involved in cell wall biosynthesis